MKIRERVSGQLFTVFGFYWSGNKCYFCCFPRNAGGLSSYAENEVEIVESSIDSDFEFKRVSEGMSGVFHRLLLIENHLEELFDHDPEAYRRFSALLGFQP